MNAIIKETLKANLLKRIGITTNHAYHYGVLNDVVGDTIQLDETTLIGPSGKTYKKRMLHIIPIEEIIMVSLPLKTKTDEK